MGESKIKYKNLDVANDYESMKQLAKSILCVRHNRFKCIINILVLLIFNTINKSFKN